MFRLRELESRDIAEINSWRNDPELISHLGAPYRYINLRVDEEWFENYMSSRSRNVRCSIVDENDELYGLVSLTNIDQLNQCAELHLMIGDTARRGKGAGTFAVREMIRHAFDDLNLHRIELECLAANETAAKLYEKCGFKKEGVKRGSVFKNGEYSDVCMYSILREEYMEVKGNE
jgi:UDP-4-amino-4,6-dideoxy-N-acetyl-beta-L-altrosamine N-acetyltransferase